MNRPKHKNDRLKVLKQCGNHRFSTQWITERRVETKYLPHGNSSVATWNHTKGCKFASSNFHSYENKEASYLHWNYKSDFSVIYYAKSKRFLQFWSHVAMLIYIGLAKVNVMTNFQFYTTCSSYGRCPLWNANLIPWLASNDNALFIFRYPLKYRFDVYRRYWWMGHCWLLQDY